MEAWSLGGSNIMSVSSRLESLEQFGWRFGLESIRALLSELGNPEQSLKVIHVAGSNGKGSTCAFMASFLKHAGYKTGLYTSPHLCDIRERFRINGTWISPSDFNRHAKRVLDACQKAKQKLKHSPTHFEALTAIAFSWFKEQKVDWVVLEVGLGGRLDATNVIQNPALTLITPVSLEHQNILGKTIAKIGREKAGILKPECAAATVQTHPDAERMITKKAEEIGASLLVGGRDFKFKKIKNGFRWEGAGLTKSFVFPNLPVYQIQNAGLALAGIQCLRTLGLTGHEQLIQKSFNAMRWPGRVEIIRQKPLTVLDGAHNPAAAKVLADFLKKKYPGKKWIVLNGFLNDKDFGSVAQLLQPTTALSIVTEPVSNRAEKGERVFEAWEKARTRTLLVRDWGQALGLALKKQGLSQFPLLITGSLYLVGDCRKELLGLKGLAQI